MNIEEAIKEMESLSPSENAIETLLTAYEKEKEKNKELEDTLKQTQNSWYEDTKVIEKQSKEIEHQIEKRANQRNELAILNAKQVEFNKLVNTVNSYKGQFKRQEKEIEEYKKQLDLDNECEIALNSKVMDLEKKIEELKEDKYGLEEEVQIQAKNLMLCEEALCEMQDKIKAKIEEVEQWELYNMKIPKLSTLDERLGAKIGIKYVLQSLLEKE